MSISSQQYKILDKIIKKINEKLNIDLSIGERGKEFSLLRHNASLCKGSFSDIVYFIQMNYRKALLERHNVYLSHFKELLTEGSSILYHATYVEYAHLILKDNKFRLTFSGATGSEDVISHGKYFYLSTSRTKYGRYAGGSDFDKPGSSVSYNCTMVLDGQKLAYNEKIKPVDYWGPEFAKAGRESGVSSDETEDRLVSNKPEIKNASKYIKEIHCYIRPEKELGQDRYYTFIRECGNLNKEAGKLNIPIYFYKDASAYKTQNKTKAETKMFSMRRDGSDTTSFVEILRGKYDPDNKNHYRVFELIGHYTYDAPASLGNDLDSIRKENYPITLEVIKEFKRFKVKNYRELIKKAIDIVGEFYAKQIYDRKLISSEMGKIK